MVKKNKKKGFTLVELLAVIVVLAIILVIAVPKILDVIKSSRENSLISSVKLIARNAEQKILTNEALGEDIDTLNCDEVADINTTDYKSCTINVNEETKEVTVTIEGKGKFSGYTCSGTKNNVTCGDDEPLVCAHGYEYDNYRIKADVDKDACVEFMISADWNEDTANALCDKDYFDGEHGDIGYEDISYDTYEDFVSQNISQDITENYYTYEDIDDYFDADIVGCAPNYLAQDWAVISGSDYDSSGNRNVKSITFHKNTSGFDGTGIDVSKAQDGSILLYKNENGYDAFYDTPLYDVYIVSNEKIYFPEDSGYLFSALWNLESINFNDSIDTSNVTDMSYMFAGCESLEELDLSSFDAKKVTNVDRMLCHGKNITLPANLNVFDGIYECDK